MDTEEKSPVKPTKQGAKQSVTSNTANAVQTSTSKQTQATPKQQSKQNLIQEPKSKGRRFHPQSSMRKTREFVSLMSLLFFSIHLSVYLFSSLYCSRYLP